MITLLIVGVVLVCVGCAILALCALMLIVEAFRG